MKKALQRPRGAEPKISPEAARSAARIRAPACTVIRVYKTRFTPFTPVLIFPIY
jgi:hypothetical protein